MTIAEFAAHHRLRTTTDWQDRTTILRGRLGQIYEQDADNFAIMITPGQGHPRYWRNARKACLACGMVLQQDGDREGCLLFDPDDPSQARAAIRWAGVRRKKSLSHKQQLVLAANFFPCSRTRENRPLRAT